MVLLIVSLVGALPVGANPPAPDDRPAADRVRTSLPTTALRAGRPVDRPNPKDQLRMRERQRLLESGQTAQAASLSLRDSDRVLVLLVEFAGTDIVTWTSGASGWDPLARANEADAVYDQAGNVIEGDCSNIIGETRVFTYTGPLHNQIPRPLSGSDRSGDSIWTPDFGKGWYDAFLFGNGVVFDYTRQDGSVVYEDRRGKSVRHYYEDMSGGRYTFGGDVIGWLQLPHSTWWYGADPCPGARSGGSNQDTGLPGSGGPTALVRDALDAVNAISNTIPGFDWRNYDRDGDGVIDRLWIVHAGYGEEDAPTLLNRTDYGEAAVWSHSWGLYPAHPVSPDIVAGPYIIMPENGGIGVFAHEYAHNLGADDLYAYVLGEPSAGFWTIMSDDWTGYPIAFQPPAVDPWHLDNWGWLDPLIITDTTRVYTVTLGQASSYPNGAGMYRGAKIVLPDGLVPTPVRPRGRYQWWGGKTSMNNARMTLRSPLAIPAGGAQLSFAATYDIELEWDYLWVQASTDGGQTWATLTNTHTICEHDVDWIGEQYGFPADMCGAGLGGLTGTTATFPAYDQEVFDLGAFAGQSVLLRFWYMTDPFTLGEGPYLDDVAVTAADGTVLFADGAESGDANWVYSGGWARNEGMQSFTHNYYLQWRNVNANGGYDSALGEKRWRFGPANTGLLVWYNNNFYSDNEVFVHAADRAFGFGPKGRMLVVDANPEPYRDPAMQRAGYDNEAGNVRSRGLMRDAPFTLRDSVGFTLRAPEVVDRAVYFAGRAAVSLFNDALGYYPGAEFAKRSPSQSAAWMTRQWDASAVLPAQRPYGIKAPGYQANEVFRYDMVTLPDGRVASYGRLPDGLGYAGGTGNPGDANIQYGWRAELIAEAADHTWATVRIHNVPPFRVSATADAAREEITYRLEMNNAGGQAQRRAFTYTLDTRLEVVDIALQGARASDGTRISGEFALAPGESRVFSVVARGKAGADLSGPITTMVEHADMINAPSVERVVRVLHAPPAYQWFPLIFK
jgi:immune inhibitor A